MFRPIAIAVLLSAGAAWADDNLRFDGATVRQDGFRVGTVDGDRIRFDSGERARIDGDRVRYSNGSSARIDSFGRIRNDMAFGTPPPLENPLMPSLRSHGFREDWDRHAKEQQRRQREWFWETSRKQNQYRQYSETEYPQYQYPQYSYYQYWAPSAWSDRVLDPYDFILDPYAAAPFAAPEKLPKD